MVVLAYPLIHTFTILSLGLKKLRWHNKSAIDLSNANPDRGHKELQRSTGHIMLKARHSNQQGFNSRQTHAKYNQRRTSETYRRQDDVFVWVRSTVWTVWGVASFSESELQATEKTIRCAAQPTSHQMYAKRCTCEFCGTLSGFHYSII